MKKTISKASTIDQTVSNLHEEKIVHSLEEDEVIETVKSAPKMDLIPTSESIGSMPVSYDEISLDVVSEDNFIITDITPAIEEITEEPETSQADLVFDLPLNSYTEVKENEEIKFNLNEEVVETRKDTPIDETEEITFGTKVKETRYVLEDFDAKPTIGKSSHITERETIVKEEEIQFELKTATAQAAVNAIETKSEEVSPLDLTISELQKRAEERRQKMKGFNYKFNDQLSKNIDEIERQPAYKRQGLDLNVDAPISRSKTAIQTDEDAIDFKSNNSFLHDNVD